MDGKVNPRSRELVQGRQATQSAAAAAAAVRQQKEEVAADNNEAAESSPSRGPWGTPRVEARSAEGKYLAGLLSQPPLPQHIHELHKACKQYSNVPQTPGPRKDAADRKFWNTQQLLENSMHYLIQHVETGDHILIKKAAALIRSAWEEQLHQRKERLAAKAQHRTSQGRTVDNSNEETADRRNSMETQQCRNWNSTAGMNNTKTQSNSNSSIYSTLPQPKPPSNQK
jgi:hypothetical protein